MLRFDKVDPYFRGEGAGDVLGVPEAVAPAGTQETPGGRTRN